jgi:GMP synthase (glutamine-hydrolysing)
MMTKPVLILQFMDDDGPAYLGTWLATRRIACDVRVAAAGELPDRIDGYAALALLGGAMSANDDLPFLRAACELVEQAMKRDVPVIGHCLGGQLMARTLGARVTASPKPEVGWHRMDDIEPPPAHDWFGASAPPYVFQWHYEAFDIPAGAVRLASSPQCPNQAFAIGKHLALQFHVEVDAAKVDLWLRCPDSEYELAQRDHETVHRRERIRQETRVHLGAQQRLADRIYRRWAFNAGFSLSQ